MMEQSLKEVGTDDNMLLIYTNIIEKKTQRFQSTEMSNKILKEVE